MLGSVLVVYCPGMLLVVVKDLENASIKDVMSLAPLLDGAGEAFEVV